MLAENGSTGEEASQGDEEEKKKKPDGIGERNIVEEFIISFQYKKNNDEQVMQREYGNQSLQSAHHYIG